MSTSPLTVNKSANSHDALKREAAFCSASGPVIFRAVAHPTQVSTPDPFDVETIHEEARDLFAQILNRATDPDSGDAKTGQILLLKGESGSGKTHLMRAFRTYTHRRGLGYFGYMQLTSASSNYFRYVLHKLIDSLDKPYYRTADAPDETTGLSRLADAVVESRRIPPMDLKQIREGDLSPREQARLIDDLTNELLLDPRFDRRENLLDLLRAMLLLQCDHPGVRARAMKYLRGEALSEVDLERLAGISALDPASGPEELLIRLGNLMWSAHGHGLVLCVDQLEDTYRSDQSQITEQRFQRVMQTLISVAAHVPTAVVVIACLEDYYDELRQKLEKPHLDRIEKDWPKPASLEANRNLDEVRQLLSAHLRHLYDEAGAPFDESDPTAPIPPDCIEQQATKRTRDVLEWAQTYRDACIAAGTVLTNCDAKPDDGTAPPPAVTDLEQLWNDFLAADLPPAPDDEDELAGLIADAVHAYEKELPGGQNFDTHHAGRLLKITWANNGKPAERLQVGICNKKAQGGGLAGQVTEVSDAAQSQVPAAIPVILRSTDFPKSPQAKISKQLGQLVARGGRRIVVQDTDWRTMLAIRSFLQEHFAHPQLKDWLAQSRPLSQLKSLADIFGGRGFLPFEDSPDVPKNDPSADAKSSIAPDPPEHSTPKADHPKNDLQKKNRLVLGRLRSRSADAVAFASNGLKRHAAFLGGTGSGKTTAALNLIEQLLLQGVPALLIDRKGDLAGYASPAVWETPASSELLQARQQQLQKRTRVALYTPGRSDGRPMTLPLVPEGMKDMHAADRQQTARQAAQSLGAMLGYGATGANAARVAILVKAIELLAGEDQRVTIQLLIDYLAEQDASLINAIGALQPKLFAKLIEDLETLKINRSNLFPEQGDPLDADALFGLGPYSEPGKTRLSVISTKFLGSDAEVQFWVAQLLLELGRWMSKNPSDDLQAVVLFDEADLYLPATTKPATKEPMENLLKRARSAGLGLLLATQSPGDLDYKCRENINTWLVGKIQQDTAIKKMQPLLSECKSDVADKLPAQQTGEFFFIHSGDVYPIQSDRSLLETEQLPEEEILRLAQAGRPAVCR